MVNIDKKMSKIYPYSCSQTMGMLNIERNAVPGILLVHSRSKVILTKIMHYVHIILLVDSQSKVILKKKIMQNVHIILLVYSQSKVILTKKIMQKVHIILLVKSIKGDTDENNAKCAHYTTCSVMENILFNMIYNAYMYYLFEVNSKY